MTSSPRRTRHYGGDWLPNFFTRSVRSFEFVLSVATSHPQEVQHYKKDLVFSSRYGPDQPVDAARHSGPGDDWQRAGLRGALGLLVQLLDAVHVRGGDAAPCCVHRRYTASLQSDSIFVPPTPCSCVPTMTCRCHGALRPSQAHLGPGAQDHQHRLDRFGLSAAPHVTHLHAAAEVKLAHTSAFSKLDVLYFLKECHSNKRHHTR